MASDEVLEEARERLPSTPLITAALDDLAWLARHLRRDYPELRLGFDLADLSGYAYYSGTRFAVYSSGGTERIGARWSL